MEIRTVPIGKLNPAAYNPRKDLKPGDPDFERLRRSLDRWDLVEPLVWNERSGNLVGGHQRLKLLQERGDAEVTVSVVDLADEDERALNLALNKIQGDWDVDLLAELITELDAAGFDLDLTGFDAAEVEELQAWDAGDLKPDEPDDVDLTPPDDPSSRLGEIYQLGPHRVMCGDSMDRWQVGELLQGESADLLVTSPPYNVGIEYSSPHSAPS